MITFLHITQITSLNPNLFIIIRYLAYKLDKRGTNKYKIYNISVYEWWKDEEEDKKSLKLDASFHEAGGSSILGCKCSGS